MLFHLLIPVSTKAGTEPNLLTLLGLPCPALSQPRPHFPPSLIQENRLLSFFPYFKGQMRIFAKCFELFSLEGLINADTIYTGSREATQL